MGARNIFPEKSIAKYKPLYSPIFPEMRAYSGTGPTYLMTTNENSSSRSRSENSLDKGSKEDTGREPCEPTRKAV
jgi:hypothetical protein